MEELPAVSVIVTAYNNGKTIVETLSTLTAQTYPSKEIIVVCDKTSKDDTVSKVEEYAKTVKEVKIVHCNGVGRSKARNIGWRSTSSSIIMFADGDDLYEKEYISKAVAALNLSSNYGGVCMGGTALESGNNLLNTFYKSYGSTDDRMPSGAEPDWAWVYRRECLDEVKGYDETLDQGEDKDLCRKVKNMGYRIAYVDGINWYHRKPETIRDLIVKEYLAGKKRVLYELKADERKSYLFSYLSPVYLAMILLAGYYFGIGIATIAIGLTLIFYLIHLSLKRKAVTGISKFFSLAILSLLVKISFTMGQLAGLLSLFVNHNEYRRRLISK